MASAQDSTADSQLSGLDEAGTIDLCKSLADYGEAGGLSNDLMLRVGQYATTAFPGNLDVLLAAARMYRLGGELDRSRNTLLLAGRLAPGEARTVGLLDDVLAALGSDDDARSLLRKAHEGATARTPAGGRAAARSTEADDRPSEAPAPSSERVATPKGAPRAGVVPTVNPSSVTQPTMRAVRAREQPSASPRAEGAPRSAMPGVEGPRPPRVHHLRLLAPDDPQRHLDPYQLIGEIASGGMATVYLGRLAGPSGFQRLVAIKRLHPHLAREEQFVEMFLDEARLAAGIHHPNVVSILEVGQSDLGYYLVMQFVEGETLAGLTARAYSRGVMLPRQVAVRIVLDTLAGLHAAHQLKDGEGRLQGLVHRDCTPQNILVGVDGSSRITDFGVARAAARLSITRPLTVKGKVAYLSPEQATAGELDRRSDIFTMGIVLWEVLAGRSLFAGESDGAIVARLLNAPIPSLRNYVKDIAPELDEVCGRALQRIPSRRYATAAAMAEALERAAIASLGSVSSHTDVGRCVEALMGPDIAGQREALNAWLTQNEGSPLSRRRVPADLSSSIPGPPLLPALPVPSPSPLPEERSASDQPVADKPGADKPGADKPGADKPVADKPGTDAVGKRDADKAAPTGSDPVLESPSMVSLPPGDPAKGDARSPGKSASIAPSPAAVAPLPTASDPVSWVRRRASWVVLGLVILVVGGSSPIWFVKVYRKVRVLAGLGLPTSGFGANPAGSGPIRRPRPRPSGSVPVPKPSAPPPAPPVDPE